MKKKFSLFLNIAMLALCVCAIAIGVYSAKQASLNVSGTIGFTAHNCDVDITASIYGHAQNDDPLGAPVLKANKVPLNGGSVLQITGADKTLSFGSRYFSDMGESGEVEPITIELTITNKSKFEVLLEDLTTTGEGANYTAVCTNPLHVLYTDEDKTTTLQYVLRPAKVDGVYQNISTPVDVSLSMKFSKLNTNISSDGFTFDVNTGIISGVPTYEQTGSDLLVIPSKFSDRSTNFTMLENYDEGEDCFFCLENINDYSKVVILKGITSIKGVLSECDSLTSFAIPSSVTSISEYAFSGCSSLTNITIPSSVTSIGIGAFDYCTSLSSITIPSSVTSIGDGAFAYCTSLTSITIPEDVTSIGDGAFDYCTSLSSITIPSSVTSIGIGAFSGCSSLTNITIPSSVTSIGIGAFAACTSLTSITIPSRVESIGERAFRDCSSLSSITVDSNNETYKSEGNAILTKDGKTLVVGCKATVIPSGVTNIGNYVFSGCGVLTSITIPSSVESIGNDAFYSCTSLTSITIGANSQLTSIGIGAFVACTSLTSITIPSRVESIGERAFRDCYSLIEVCNLSSLTITAGATDNGGVAQYAKGVITNPLDSKLTTINDYVIYNESETSKILVKYIGTNTSLELPSVVTSIHDYAFYENRNITSVTIPEGVTSIGNFAFYHCSSLTSINIPANVTSIGADAFMGCTGLTEMTVLATTPPTLSGTNSISSATTKIKVPAGTKSAYQNAAFWKNLTKVTFEELSA